MLLGRRKLLKVNAHIKKHFNKFQFDYDDMDDDFCQNQYKDKSSCFFQGYQIICLCEPNY